MSELDKHIDGFLKNKMRTGESMDASVKGYMSSKKKDSKDALMTGRLFLTDQRVCFYRKGIIGEKFESIDLKNIKSLESGSLLGHRTVTLYSTQNELVFNTFKPKEEFDPLVAKIETLINAGPETSGHSSPSISLTDQLEKLAGLHKGGILSEQEFSTKKAEILARI